MVSKITLGALAVCCTTSVYAVGLTDQSATDSLPINFKLTPSYYQASDGNNAVDINIRGNRGPHAGWIGYYRDKNGYQQARTGYEFTHDAGWAQTVWSAQSASGGFLGGSINTQLGRPYYAIIGFGRTNLHDYYNLNFDPNDAITLGIGTSVIPNTEVSFFHIWDDRLGTQQRVTHLYLHHNISENERFSIDGAYKSGLSTNNNFVRGYALTATYAYRQYFVRLAHDQYANFSNTTQNRLSLGMTF